ncbi:hypothetical protein Fcan01_20133 [Folsomia candida]|uniref:DUF4806 domain-containing protein n=1 Tax=Folsomia candida TaxID=158441 RepID=A0A226DKA7_FOLCA|nr:hypothetical protein Fcan01_20133 [Folsomia candida]
MKQNRSIPTKTIPPPPQYFSLVGEGLQSEKEDSHESSLPGPSDPPSPTNSQQYQGTLSSEQVLSSSHELESRSIPQAEDIDTTFGRDNGTSPNAGNLEFQKWMVRQMNVMKAQLRQLQESVDVLVSNYNWGTKTGGQNEKFPVGLLPVDDESDLKKLEDFAKASRITLITELQKGIRATKDVKIATQRILAKLLTDKYASSYNWIGSRGPKSPFSKSWMKHIIYGKLVRQFKDWKTWATLTTTRFGKQLKIGSKIPTSVLNRKKLEKSNAALPLRNTGPESDN